MNKFVVVFLSVVAIAVCSEMHCFQCTSNEDPVCSTNDAAALASFKKPCAPLTDGPFKGKSAIGCRKIDQFVGEEQSVVRECAFSGDNVEGMKKTGNHGIKLFYYQCSNDMNDTPCNKVGTSFSLLSIISILAVYLLQ